MTISIALLTALAISVFAGSTGTDLATNSNLVIILLIALIALSQPSYNNYCPRNRFITTDNIVQTIF